MMALLSLTWSFTAFAVIALTMQRHQPDFLAEEKAAALPMHTIRALGFALLLLSLWPCLLLWPAASLAIVAWLGLLTLAAMALGLLLTYYAPHARRILLGGGAASLGVAAISLVQHLG